MWGGGGRRRIGGPGVIGVHIRGRCAAFASPPQRANLTWRRREAAAPSLFHLLSRSPTDAHLLDAPSPFPVRRFAASAAPSAIKPALGAPRPRNGRPRIAGVHTRWRCVEIACSSHNFNLKDAVAKMRRRQLHFPASASRRLTPAQKFPASGDSRSPPNSRRRIRWAAHGQHDRHLRRGGWRLSVLSAPAPISPPRLPRFFR